MAFSKKFILVFGMFLMVMMMVSLASASKWDNKEKFNKSVGKYGKYEIHDSWFLGIGYGKKLLDIELVNNSDLCLNNCLAIKEIELYEKDESLVDDIKFLTEQKDGSWVEQDVREYTIYVAKRQGKQKLGDWEVYSLGQEMDKKGSYLIKLEAEKKETRTVDWQIKTQGIWTTEWAVWNFNWDEWIAREYADRLSWGNLTVNTTVTMGGNYNYSHIVVEAGGKIEIDTSYGYLNLTAFNVTVESGGEIEGYARSANAGGGGGSPIPNSPCRGGYSGGTGAGGGGSGGAGAFDGGSCTSYPSASGGGGAGSVGTTSGRYETTTYGRGGGGGGAGSGANVCCEYGLGSAGAGGNRGGAVIRLDSPHLTVTGTLDARGGNGGNGGAGYNGGWSGTTNGGAGGGGASGGQVILDGVLVNLNSSTIQVHGGSGGSGGSGRSGSTGGSGSGGGGGRYKAFYGVLSTSGASIAGGSSYTEEQEFTGLVTLISPPDNDLVANTDITFIANATVDGGAYLTNVSLWTNSGGTWGIEESVTDLFSFSSQDTTLGTSGATTASDAGVRFRANKDLMLRGAMVNAIGTRPTIMNLWWDNGTLIESVPIVSEMGNFTDFQFDAGDEFRITANNSGVDYYQVSKTSIANNGTALEVLGGYENSPSTTGWNIRFVMTDSFITSTQNTFNFTLNDTSIEWNFQYCDTDTDCGFAEENYTLNIDVGPPMITVHEPSGKYDFGKEGATLPINVTALDVYLDSCWYEYNGINQTFNCSETTTFTLGDLNNISMRVWSNDTLGNTGYTDSNWTYYLWQEGGTTYNTEAGEISEQTYETTVLLPDGDAIQSAQFVYNGTSYTPDISLNGGSADLSYELTTPNVVATTNYTFYWNFSINPVIETDPETQTVIAVNVDDCSNFSEVILNYTLVDELTEAVITGNTSIEIDLTLETAGGSEILAFYQVYDDTPYASVCMEELLNDTEYQMDVVTSYVADNYVQEFWYLDDGILRLNDSSLNDYVDKEVTLRALPIDDSTTFLFKYLDEFYSIHDNSIVSVLRYYISQGVYKEVERCQQDSNGECHLHLVEEDVIYRFRVTDRGALEYLSGEYNAKCLSTICSITLTKKVEGGQWDTELDGLEVGTFSVTSDKDTREVTLAFNLEETGEMQLDVFEYDQDADADTLVATDSVVATTGTALVTIPVMYGNKTYYSVVRHNDDFVSSQWIDMNDDGYKYFGNLGLFLGALLVLTLGLIAVSSGGWTIGFLSLGMVVASITKLVDMEFYLLMYVVCAGALLIWKLSTRRSI